MSLPTPNFSSRNFTLTYLGWWTGWGLLHTLVLVDSVGLTTELAAYDSALTNGLLALAGYLIIHTMKFYQPRKILKPLTWSILFAVVCMASLHGLISHLRLIDNEGYITFVDKSLFIRGVFGWLVISLITIISWWWFYMLEQREIEQRKADTEKLAREAELSNLRLQLQPHFLFNSLNSISALAGSRPEEARNMIQQLSDFLRGTIRRDDQQMVPLDDELAHLQLYLDIEKVRFGHRLKTVIRKDDACATLVIPSLLLQPVVENAIKFGLYDTTGEITISIVARVDNGQLVITVENPYDPQTASPRRGTGFGLSSVQRRLYLLFARNDLLHTQQQENNIFTTTLKIPQPV